jgi:hypothetical protein
MNTSHTTEIKVMVSVTVAHTGGEDGAADLAHLAQQNISDAIGNSQFLECDNVYVDTLSVNISDVETRYNK